MAKALKMTFIYTLAPPLALPFMHLFIHLNLFFFFYNFYSLLKLKSSCYFGRLFSFLRHLTAADAKLTVIWIFVLSGKKFEALLN